MEKSDQWRRLLSLLQEHSLEKRPVILSSGRKSDYYVDAKRVLLEGEGSYLTAHLMLERIGPEVKAVAGMTLGADPIVSSIITLGHVQGRALSALIIRKEAKKHGTMSFIEGPPLPMGSPVVVVDDVLTTGASILKSIQRLDSAGFTVVKALALLDRMEGGREAVEGEGYSLETIYTRQDLMEISIN